MAIPSIVQSGQGASSSAAPASYTQAFTQASTAGTLLLAAVAVATTGASTYSVPAGWVLAMTVNASGIDLRIYYYPNNPGSLANIAITSLTNDNAVAVGFAEVAGINVVAPFDLSSTVANASGTSIQPNTKTNILGNEVWYGALAWLTGGGALTPGNVGTWTSVGSATSTNGATNLQLQHWYSLPGPVFATQGVRGTIAVSAANAGVFGTWYSTSSGAALAQHDNAGMLATAGAGYAVGI